jgi:hypothetical protein
MKAVAYTATILLVIVSFCAAPNIYHYILFPLTTPRFDGAIVYVDNNEEMTGQLLLRSDGVLYERRGFFGRWNKEFIVERPDEAETWSISVSVESWGRAKIRIVDGQSRKLLVEKESYPVYIEGFPRRVYVLLWYP